MEMAPLDGVAESAAVESAEAAVVEEYRGSGESAAPVGLADGDIPVRAGQVGDHVEMIRAARAGSSFTGPFVGNPRVLFRKRFVLDRARRERTPTSKNIM